MAGPGQPQPACTWVDVVEANDITALEVRAPDGTAVLVAQL